MKNLLKYFLIIFSSLISADIKEHQGILATLYVQDSAEYYANSINVYRSAMDKLPSVLSNNTISAAIEQTKDFKDKPPAVVLDVDQTVLDNIAYQARLIKTRTYYPEGWDAWCMEEQADYVPGVKEFLDYATELGVEIFFVTNRTANLEEATKNNLEKLGFIFKDGKDQLLMKGEKGWGSNKNSRRSLIAEDYRIVMMFGDNLGDFIDGSDNKNSSEHRMEVTKKHQDMWGQYWFMLPNPNYGDWESSIINFKYNISKEKQLQIKIDALDTK